MATFNKILLIGNLTRDPETRQTQSGITLTRFGIASTRKWTSKSGEQDESTLFIDCSLFGKGAEVFSKWTTKGSLVLLEGRLELHEWDTPDGQHRTKHEVFVETFQFLDRIDKDKKKLTTKQTSTTLDEPSDLDSAPF